MTVADIYFVHQRGLANTIYFWFMTVGVIDGGGIKHGLLVEENEHHKARTKQYSHPPPDPAVADIYFVHQRGLANTIYFWFMTVGVTLSPLAGGFITQSLLQELPQCSSVY
jgi:hypothetical protein